MITLHHYIILSIILFTIGAIGAITRRNVIVIFMCIELMLNAANIAFLAFARWDLLIQGKIFVLFIVAIAAAETAIGLAIIILLYRNKKTVCVDEMNILRG